MGRKLPCYSCSYICPYDPNRIYYASTKISGDNSNLCTGTRTFTVKNISGATYTWTYSSSLSPVGATNTNQLDVQRNGSSNGAAWVEVQISTPCSGSSAVSRQYFSVGVSQPGPITFQLIDPTFGRIHATIDPVPGAASYNWYKNSSLVSGYNGTFASIPIARDVCGVDYDISVEAVNACGTSAQTHANAYVTCDGYFVMSPNPAASSFTVEVINSDLGADETTSSQKNAIQKILLTDKMGNVIKLYTYPALQKVTINISDLKADTYFVRIFNGKDWVSKQLSVLR